MEELLVKLKEDLTKLPMTISKLEPVQDRLQMNERYTVAHLLTASANLNEDQSSETNESKQQKEQFKELAKNKHVAKALRFCNETGSFYLGSGIELPQEVIDEVIELDDDDSNVEKKEGENSEKMTQSTDADKKEENGTEKIEKAETEKKPTENGEIEEAENESSEKAENQKSDVSSEEAPKLNGELKSEEVKKEVLTNGNAKIEDKLTNGDVKEEMS